MGGPESALGGSMDFSPFSSFYYDEKMKALNSNMSLQGVPTFKRNSPNPIPTKNNNELLLIVLYAVSK